MGKRKYCTQETFDVSDVILPPVCLGSIFFGAIFPNSTNRVNQLNWLNLVGYNARRPRFWPEDPLIFATHLGRMHLSLPQGAGSRCAWNLEITSFQDVPYWNQGFHSFQWWDIKFSLHATGDLSQCYNILFFFEGLPHHWGFLSQQIQQNSWFGTNRFFISPRLAFSRKHGGLPFITISKTFLRNWVIFGRRL